MGYGKREYCSDEKPEGREVKLTGDLIGEQTSGPSQGGKSELRVAPWQGLRAVSSLAKYESGVIPSLSEKSPLVGSQSVPP